MALNLEQKTAVEYLEGPLLVLAGPGTGKTELLSTKVAYILEQTDANSENILCLTFTESGASNMCDRLGTMIGQTAADVHIYTYHAFGTYILERYQNYAENFSRRLDSVIDNVTTHKLLHEIQEKLPVTDILKTANLDDIAETIAHAKSARLSASDLREIAKINIKDSNAISGLVSEILLRLKPREKFDVAVAEVYQPLLEVLTDFSSAKPITKDIERSANILVRELSEIITAESVKEKPSVSSLTKWKNKRFEREENGGYRLKDHIANRKLTSLAEVMHIYDKQLKTEGLFDFADMIEEAILALKTDRGFRLSLSESFQYILLDEFQDTNPSQFELIKLLTDYERPLIMAVGDDDQAIFEFQGASASNLLDFQNHYQAKVVTLHDNYRSRGEILDFSHHIALEIDDSFAKILRSMKDLARKDNKKAVFQTIERHEFQAATDEYYWLAEKIAELVKNGEDANEIAIIAPKHKFIEPLLPYLKARELNVAYEKRANLLEDEKLHELIVLAEVVDALANGKNPAHYLLEILSFPFFEVSPLEALDVAQKLHDSKGRILDVLSKAESKQLQNISAWLAELVMLSFEAPLELWLDYLLGNAVLPKSKAKSKFLDYYDKVLNDTQKLEFYDNLATLRNITNEHMQKSQLKLADFIDTLKDYEDAGAGIMNTSSFQDGQPAVQIMSAHKSKGLEFKYVFLISVDELAWGKAKGNNNLFSLPSNLVQIRHTGITDDERLRLLFVAATRAKEHLIMTNSIQNFFDKTTARLGYLNEQRDEKSEVQISPFLPEKYQEIRLHTKDFNQETQLLAKRQGWMSKYEVLEPDLKLLLTSRLKNYRLTATDLASFIDIIYAGPETVYRRRILHAPDEPLTVALAYGNLMHASFEQVTNGKVSDDNAIEFLREKAAELPLPQHDIEELKDRGSHGLKIALKSFRDILRAEGAKAEVSLGAERPNLDGVPLTGKIDHLEINEKAKTIEVYDFKTGNFHDGKWQNHPSLYKYALQLGFYKLLLNLSPSYRNYKVTKGHILFVSPDQDDRVYDKVYEFSENEEAELKALMKVVYRQITSLEFLEDTDLNLASDKSRTLKDIKTFVVKLLEQN